MLINILYCMYLPSYIYAVGIKHFSSRPVFNSEITGQSDDNTEATETFSRMFGKFFDIWNTKALEESDKKLKPNLKPFYYDFD